ncbi:hypothetical protein GCM10009737_25600 [Nocardioides lentus]|uniref:Uncharacterized protein n=1 Tax=Nocardioides lentus TaxID=338077 RepID=A0ABN2PIQ9_9ACTN
MSPPTPVARPLGVAVAGTLAVVSGALGLVAAVVGLLSLGVGLRLLDEVPAPLRPDLVGQVAPVVAASVVLVAVLAGLAALEAALGLGVLRGRSLARLVLTVWNLVVAVPLAWTLLADLADPAVPLVSTAKVLDVVALVVALTVVGLLWTSRAGAWFADRARLARLARLARPATDTGGVPPPAGPPYARRTRRGGAP